MNIVLYDTSKNKIFVASDKHKIQSFNIGDPNIIFSINDDTVFYVTDAAIIAKKQLLEWLNVAHVPSQINPLMAPESESSPIEINSNSRWIHPVHNGAIFIADLKSPKYPNGVEMVGKYDFVSVDDLGGFEALEESIFYKTALAKGRIEVVDANYVKKNSHKKKQKSLADEALDAIIVRDSTQGAAEKAARRGGIRAATDTDETIEFLVE